MCAAYMAPPGDAGPVAPEFSPASLCDSEGRLLCVPELVLGVSLDHDGTDFRSLVRRAARLLQLDHHPDRPGGDAELSRCVEP